MAVAEIGRGYRLWRGDIVVVFTESSEYGEGGSVVKCGMEFHGVYVWTSSHDHEDLSQDTLAMEMARSGI